MASEGILDIFINLLVSFATDYLLPFMVMVFFIAIIFRALIFLTIKREDWFAKEFEKRVHRFFDDLEASGIHNTSGFFMVTKSLLERTYHEIFEKRALLKRRKADVILDLSDRIFLIQHGSVILIKDALKQIKYLKHAGDRPKLLEISKSIFQNNPCFNKVFGLIPAAVLNDVLSILPGLFIVGGIFGTFLGIMKALPTLGTMDLADVEKSKMIMDAFLLRLSFSMSTSIMGIVLSVFMTIFNTLLFPEKLFVNIVERFENSLDMLWNYSRIHEEEHGGDLRRTLESIDTVQTPSDEALKINVNDET